MNFLEDEVEELVEEITFDKFNVFCGIDGCNEAILDSVREQVKEDVYQSFGKEKKQRDEIIHVEKDKLMDIFLAKKSAYENGFKDEPNIEKDAEDVTPQFDMTSDNVVEELKKSLKAVQPPESALEDVKPSVLPAQQQLPLPPHQKITPELIASIEPSTNLQEDIQYNMTVTMYKNNIDVWSRIKGLDMRGKDFPISPDGSCPKCGFKSNVFVILDSLFPAGDLPEILQNLLTQGKAILWSSKKNMKCKEPPTFLCSGNCPFTDIKKCGFNIDLNLTDLERIFSGRKNVLNIDLTEDIVKDDSTKEDNEDDYDEEEEDYGEEYEEEEEEEEYDEGLVDIKFYRDSVSWVVLDEFVEKKDGIPDVEKDMIRTMLALELARDDFVNGKMKTIEYIKNEDDDGDVIFIDSSSDENANSSKWSNSPASEVEIHDLEEEGKKEHAKKEQVISQNSFPVSKDGSCPYCRSKNVVYILLKEGGENDPELPELLMKLKKEGKAETRIKGEHEWPSFQCRGCTYGFNLDWTLTDLEKIFYSTPPPQKQQQKPQSKSSTAYQATLNNSRVSQRVSTLAPNRTASFSGYAPQVKVSLSNLTAGFIPQVNLPGFTHHSNIFPISGMQPTIVPPTAVPKLVVPTIPGGMPKLIPGGTMSAPRIALTSVSAPQIIQPTVQAPQLNTLPFMPRFQPFPGMFPMQHIPLPMGMAPELSSTLMNALNTVQQTQQQMSFIPNPMVPPTLQWNGQNMWLAPPPPPQTQPSRSTVVASNSHTVPRTDYSYSHANYNYSHTDYTSPSTSSQTTYPSSGTITSGKNEPNKDDVSKKEETTDGNGVIDLTTGNKQQSTSSSLETTDSTKEIDLTTTKEIETVDMTTASEIETIDMTTISEIETIDMTTTSEIETVDMTTTKEIETVDMTTDCKIEKSTSQGKSNVIDKTTVNELLHEEKKFKPKGSSIKKEEVDEVLNNGSIIETTQSAGDASIKKENQENLFQAQESSAYSVREPVAIKPEPQDAKVKTEPLEQQAPAPRKQDSAVEIQNAAKPTVVRISLPFADDSGDESSPSMKHTTPVNNSSSIKTETKARVDSPVEPIKPNTLIETRKRTMNNSPLNSPVKNPRLDARSSRVTPSRKSPEKKSFLLPFVGKLELLGDGPDLMNEDSMGIDDNAINTRLLLPGEDTPSGGGANSPFTDSLFNIVSDNTESRSDTKGDHGQEKQKEKENE